MASHAPQTDLSTGQDPTRERLLDAAERLFAESGYAGTSIRDLTAEAGCNIAAVNYHFGGKDALYQQVYLRRLRIVRQQRLRKIRRVMAGEEGDVNLERLLTAFANVFVEPVLSESSGRRLMQLLMREMTDPRLPRDLFIREAIRPVQQALREALQQVAPELTPTQAELCVHSFVAQLIHILQVRQMLVSSEGDHRWPVLDLEQAVDHVVRFSIAGVRGIATHQD
ncbi:MAG: TetR/AcrR family transcriptional regulator [Phycisphaeraceae bacterium]